MGGEREVVLLGDGAGSSGEHGALDGVGRAGPGHPRLQPRLLRPLFLLHPLSPQPAASQGNTTLSFQCRVAVPCPLFQDTFLGTLMVGSVAVMTE